MRNRLLHAGYYHTEAITWFLAVKVLLLVIPGRRPILLSLLNIVPWSWSLGSAALFGLLGLACPGLWLSWKKTHRQITFRAALPDVLDVLVICLEGGGARHPCRCA